ncbi:MAG: hypothetical protein WDO71_17860 [Bacteroidota bacterium]
MSSYVMVTADFPGVNADNRAKIYECLKAEKWKKITEPGRDIDTVWYASFEADVKEEDAIKISINDFVKCSKTYCQVKLVIHWGPHKPYLSWFGLV